MDGRAEIIYINEGMKMRKTWFGIFLFVFFSLLISSVSLAKQLSGPKMIIIEKDFDFKEVDQGIVIKHTFKVLNKGDRPLEIRKVKPG